ncbi:hypothetical protein ABKN59_007263 [Abortiporus biennis]
MSIKREPTYLVEQYVRPGRHMTVEQCHTLITELRTFAATSLSPLPSYQCLSYVPRSLDDKLIIIIRQYDAPHDIVAFTSTVFMDSMPSLEDKVEVPSSTVLHLGLTAVSPHLRGSQITKILFYYVFCYMVTIHPQGFWLTSPAEVISSLGSVVNFAKDCYPTPGIKTPSPTHLRIALEVDRKFRDVMLISPNAVFDERTFVFKGSNQLGSCFRKEADEERYNYRNRELTVFFRALLGRGEWNEVLQVGYIDRNHLETVFKAANLNGGKVIPLKV